MSSTQSSVFPRRFYLPFSSVDLWNAAIVLVSLWILFWFFHFDVLSLTVLLLGLIGSYAYLVAAESLPQTQQQSAHRIFIVTIAVLFFLRKYIGSIPGYWVALMLQNVGLGYLALKLISYALDSSPAKRVNRNWLSFLGYCLFAPTFLAGPLFDYRLYSRLVMEQFNLSSEARSLLLLKGLKRIILGLFQTRVVAFIMSRYTFFNWPESTLLHMPWYEVIFIIQLTLVELYFNFSGYSDVAIGLGNCLGLSIPENFNRPFYARNLQEFWSRWHITLAEWFRMYVFFPINRQLLRLSFLKKRLAWAAGIAVFLTFIVMGLWHGCRWNDLVYGAMHGIGFLIALGLRKQISVGSVSRPWWDRIWDVSACVLTLHYVALALLVFYVQDDAQLHQLVAVLGRLW